MPLSYKGLLRGSSKEPKGDPIRAIPPQEAMPPCVLDLRERGPRVASILSH
jgi:hypothetical protein